MQKIAIFSPVCAEERPLKETGVGVIILVRLAPNAICCRLFEGFFKYTESCERKMVRKGLLVFWFRFGQWKIKYEKKINNKNEISTCIVRSFL